MKASIVTIFLAVSLMLVTISSTATGNTPKFYNNKVESITLTLKNTVNIRGSIDERSMKIAAVQLEILRQQNPKETIYLVINSGGGQIDAGLQFIRFAKSLDNVKTITLEAASMASAIVEALPGERLMTENATFMFHRARGSVEGFYDGEIESRLAFFKKMIAVLEEGNAKRIGISLSNYKANVLGEWWLVGKEAIRNNVADRIVSLKCDKELTNTLFELPEQTMFGTVVKKVSSCPLL